MSRDRPRYQAIAGSLAQSIARGLFRPGERFPSVRQAGRSHRVAVGTMLQAYDLLERQGLIQARPRSGYFVCAPRTPRHQEPERSEPSARSRTVDVSELVFQLLDELKGSHLTPLGSAFPSPELFPQAHLRRACAAAARHLDPWSSVQDLPPGNMELRRAIAQRYQLHGCELQADDIVITNGALEAINLCLQVLTRPGDTVAVESPTFYATLQAIERLGLRALEIATDPRTGIDVDELGRALKRQSVRACIVMSNFQNPLGCTLPEERKIELVRLLERHEVPLIEDDVYAELYFGSERPRPAKHFDRAGLVMHCGSFAKCLAPGFRVGWCVPGRQRVAMTRLKAMTSIATASLPQAALARYLREHAYERHLRTLRSKLSSHLQDLSLQIDESFPAQCRVTRPQGGYQLWVELPPQIDTIRLHSLAQRDGISIAPGPLFSVQRAYRNCLRLNFGHPWSAPQRAAVRRLGRLIASGDASVDPP